MQRLQMPNPKFADAQNAGRSVYGIQANILNFSVMPDGSLLVPRGCRKSVISLAESFGQNFEIKDERQLFPHLALDSSKIKYRPYQFDAVIKLFSEHNEAILVAPAGSGKTVMGLSMIPLSGQPTLWLTHTGPLAKQARERAEFFLPDIGEIGRIGGGKWIDGEVLTIGMIQTLIRNPEKLIRYRNKYGMVILDECLPKGTDILMLDGSVKDVEDVKNGDVTTFGRTSNKFSRKTDKLVTLRGGWGKISGTETHLLPFVPKTKLKLNKHTGTFIPLSESDVDMANMSEIQTGDFLLASESACHTELKQIGVGKARLLALIACDGHIEKHFRCIQVGITKDKHWFKHEMLKASSLFSDSVLKLSECARGDLIIREYSKEAVGFLIEYIPAGRKQNLSVPCVIKTASIKEIRNYLQVVFDTEGGLNRNQITITMSEPRFILDIQYLLRKFGIMARVIPIKKHNKNAKDGYLRLAMSGYDAFLFYSRIGFSMKRKQDALLEIVKRANKFVRRVEFGGVTYRCVEVINKKIEHKEIEVFDFTTEKHFFIANGILSSNCHHCPATTFLQVISHLNPYYLFGLTATPKRRDKLERLMYQTIGEERVVITQAEVESHGGIMIPTIKYKAVPGPPVRGNNIQAILKKHIVGNVARNRMIAGDVLAEAVRGHFCIVISDRKQHCEDLYDLLQAAWPKTGIATGNYSKKYVEEQVQRYHDNEITILVATYALLGEGFDVPFLDRAFITMPFRAENKAEQLIGRVQRTHPGKKDAVVYDYVDTNIGVLANQFFNKSRDCRYNVYVRLGANIEPA